MNRKVLAELYQLKDKDAAMGVYIGKPNANPNCFDKVYTTEVDWEEHMSISLDIIVADLAVMHPTGFTGRNIAPGDIVVAGGTAYLFDMDGSWRVVDFASRLEGWECNSLK